MDYMRLLYRILKLASNAMNLDEIPVASEIFIPDVLKATKNEIEAMIRLAYEEGYITGVRLIEVDGMTKPTVIMQESHITPTIKGLEYMSENTVMRKIASAVKGVKEIIPGA